MDPCELRLARGDAAVRELVAGRTPLFAFAIRSTLAGFDLTTAEGRVAALRRAAPRRGQIRDTALRPEYARLAGGLGRRARAEVRAAVAAAGHARGSRAGGRGGGPATRAGRAPGERSGTRPESRAGGGGRADGTGGRRPSGGPTAGGRSARDPARAAPGRIVRPVAPPGRIRASPRCSWSASRSSVCCRYPSSSAEWFDSVQPRAPSGTRATRRCGGRWRRPGDRAGERAARNGWTRSWPAAPTTSCGTWSASSRWSRW